MGRSRRQWVSQHAGSFHIIYSTAGALILFEDEEKEYFLKLLERFAAGFFIQIHTFCIRGNHFHILATSMELEAKYASDDELQRRYRRRLGKIPIPWLVLLKRMAVLFPTKMDGWRDFVQG